MLHAEKGVEERNTDLYEVRQRVERIGAFDRREGFDSEVAAVAG